MLILKLLLAHLIGDFVLQPSQWVKHKEKHRLKSKYLYVHAGIHLLLVFAAYNFNVQAYPSILLIVVSHLLIDAIKIHQPISNNRLLFIVDQIAHLLILYLVVYGWEIKLDQERLFSDQNLLLIVAIILLSSVCNVLLKLIFSKWSKELEKASDKDSSLTDAGKYIGILERLMVFCFVVLNQWEAIGFLLAAKSVFRFGDLSKSKDRLLTEYILIGTLLSFGFAIAIGLGFNYFSSTL